MLIASPFQQCMLLQFLQLLKGLSISATNQLHRETSKQRTHLTTYNKPHYTDDAVVFVKKI